MQIHEYESGQAILNQALKVGDEPVSAPIVVGGKIMAFPVAERAANNAKVLIARQDWLDKLSLKMPTTLDEVKTVALAFKNAKLGTGSVPIGLNMSMSIGRGATRA